ncbi:sulfotransferase family 2 domain-containing protein [Celeribacter arenosi]|uniref:Sulfotransferase family protein n=1 Tax=Celeribacter arenosi TaxID=792649 RepID=A0ABP7KCX3_9RHOB
MATIVCDSKRFVFVHIPKCAGMSISVQLKELVDWDERFTGSVLYEHSALGRVMAAHLPLPVLDEFYPKTFAKYRDYATYAVLRDPHARFVSAVAQHLREFRGKDMYDLRAGDLNATMDDIMAQMAQTPVKVPVEYVHFTRQHDYVCLGEERIVQELYTTETLGDFANTLAERHDVHLNANESRNRTVGYRSRGVKRVMHAGGFVIRNLLPEKAYQAIRSQARGKAMVTTKHQQPALFNSDTVRDFVETFYEDDFVLWNAQAKNAAAPNPVIHPKGETRDAH